MKCFLKGDFKYYVIGIVMAFAYFFVLDHGLELGILELITKSL